MEGVKDTIEEISITTLDDEPEKVMTILEVLATVFEDDVPIIDDKTQRNKLKAKIVEICERW